MKRYVSFMLVLVVALCLVSPPLNVAMGSVHETQEKVSKIPLIWEVDSSVQRFDSIFLTQDLMRKYDYEFVYGFKNFDKLALPEAFLKESTTEELAVAVIGHPEMTAISCYLDKDLGFDEVYQRFSGMQELMSRKDAGRVLAEMYLTMPYATDDEFATFTYENCGFYCSMLYVPRLKAFYSLFTPWETEQINNKIMGNHYEQMAAKEDSDAYQELVKRAEFVYEFEGTALRRAYIADYSVLADEVGYNTRNDPNWGGETAWADGYQLKVRTASSLYRTKGGQYFPVLFFLEDIPDARRAYHNTQMYNEYGLTPVSKPGGGVFGSTALYNCISYGWMGMRDFMVGVGNYFISDTQHSGLRMTTSDALTDATFQYAVQVGDVLVPASDSGSHAMKVVAKSGSSITVREKWDVRGEYQYTLGSHTPYYNPAGTPPYPRKAYYLK